jgi:hypothetical protein
MKQTAVEWLEQQMKNFAIDLDLLHHVEQAKAMEKKQIIAAVNSQRQSGWDEKGEEYYEQTYGNEK